MGRGLGHLFRDKKKKKFSTNDSTGITSSDQSEARKLLNHFGMRMET